MEELFAMEELATVVSSPVHQQKQQQPHQPIELMEIQSSEDPILIQDPRVLNNLIKRQQSKNSSPKNPEAVVDFFQTIQSEVKPHMRKIVCDWMLEVTEEQQCQPDVFHLAVQYLDRYLSVKPVKKNQFQLIAAVCMFLASKFKETCPLSAEHLVVYTDYSISIPDIMHYELIVLEALQWDLSAVTPYSILDQILRSVPLEVDSTNPSNVRKHAETFVALAATEYHFTHKSPALIAVASLGSALRGLNPNGLEAMLTALQYQCGVQRELIEDCMEQIEAFINSRMTDMSFQPKNNNTLPKQIKQSNFYSTASTTPTDIMDVSKAYC